MSDPGLDAILHLLAAGERREIVDTLRQQATGETTIGDLAEHLAAAGQVTENDSKRLSIKLHHAHLPKLADHGLVEFDPDRGSVRYRPNERVERVIDSLSESGRPAVQSGSSD